MNILNAMLNAQDGGAVRQLGSQVGLAPDQTTAALSALSLGNHGQYIDNPAALGDQSAVADGNGILGHVLGSKDVSREVASRAAAQTGLSADILKRMLPLAATLMMGAFAKQSGNASPRAAGLGGSRDGIAAMLLPLLDQNRDGSIMDDVTSMIGRFIKPS